MVPENTHSSEPVPQHTEATRVPSVTVIMPMFNAGHMIEECLEPLVKMRQQGLILEIIVVNDGSTDDSVSRVAAIPEVDLLHTKSQSGPGRARNLGAASALGDYLWFVDADVIVADNAGEVVQRELGYAQTETSVAPAAYIGAYDTSPRARNFLSQYKNLVHHYYHSRARTEAETFWSGCGLVDREKFLNVDGFDVERFPYPSVEDIDLGYRLRAAGHRIRLVKDLNGKHLKEWRLGGLLHTEIFRRALPWSRLLLAQNSLTNDLNVSETERIRALMVGLWGLLLLVVIAGSLSWGWLVFATLALFLVNWPIMRFFFVQKGLRFALGACAFHQLYYGYSSVAFVAAWLEKHAFGARTG